MHHSSQVRHVIELYAAIVSHPGGSKSPPAPTLAFNVAILSSCETLLQPHAVCLPLDTAKSYDNVYKNRLDYELD